MKSTRVTHSPGELNFCRGCTSWLHTHFTYFAHLTHLTLFHPTHSAHSARYSKLTWTASSCRSSVLGLSKMWLDGDPRLLVYFFLYEISGVMLILLLISFGVTKGIRRYACFVIPFSCTLTIFLFPVTRTPGDHLPCWRPQFLS